MQKNKIIDENSEFYAKNLLEETFPHIFHNLQKGESPDLYQDDLYGIEVTQLGFENDLKATKIWNRNAGVEKSNITKRDLSILPQLTPKYNDSEELISIDPPKEWREGAVDVKSVIENKIRILNKTSFNSNFHYNGLFIVYKDFSYKTSIEEIIHTFNATQALAPKTFDFLVIWDYFNLHFYYDSIYYKSSMLSYDRLQSVKEKTIADFHRFEESQN